jgi:uncharacterized coiled-coil DUF342 family protein
MSTHAEYIAKMEAQLKKWDTEVDELRAKGKQLATELRAGYFGRIKDLRSHRDEGQRKFQEIRTATDEAAAKLHAGMEGAWESMRSALAKASSDGPAP